MSFCSNLAITATANHCWALYSFALISIFNQELPDLGIMEGKNWLQGSIFEIFLLINSLPENSRRHPFLRFSSRYKHLDKLHYVKPVIISRKLDIEKQWTPLLRSCYNWTISLKDEYKLAAFSIFSLCVRNRSSDEGDKRTLEGRYSGCRLTWPKVPIERT